eukprot:TRINITY_DN30650_c0_g1_i1.p1 TRINITY_DN30650_c0_g1~~TRINITY_DN30650_c0_g1_i1.p1  ORF type:complete len:416 (+),score=133.68 TRINITY_DN30650_c0_g1_i1:182-1249(+)
MEQAPMFLSFASLGKEELAQLPHRAELLTVSNCEAACSKGNSLAVLQWHIDAATEGATAACQRLGPPFTSVLSPDDGSVVGSQCVKVWRTMHSLGGERGAPGDGLVHSVVLCAEVKGKRAVPRWGVVELEAHRLMLAALGMLGRVHGDDIAAPKRVALLGVGFGTQAVFIARTFPGWEVHAVDIEPAALALAQEFSGFGAGEPAAEGVRIHVADAAEWLCSCELQFDLILVDCSECGFAPEGFTAVGFQQQLRRCLRPGGVVVQNALYPDEAVLQSQVAPLRTAFADLPTVALRSALFSQTVLLTALPPSPAPAADALRAACEKLQSDAGQHWHFDLAVPFRAEAAARFSVMGPD